MPDIITARDSSIENLNIMNEMPIPGGREEMHLNKLQEETNKEHNDTAQSKRKTANRFVIATRRDNSAVRNEVVQSAIKFLSERINIENNGAINSLK